MQLTVAHPSDRVTPSNVACVVHYHEQTQAQAYAHDKLSMATESFVRALLEHAPDCVDREVAIRCAREAKLWASAAVALQSLAEPALTP